MFYFIGISDMIWRHMTTVPQNNDPSVAKGLNKKGMLICEEGGGQVTR